MENNAAKHIKYLIYFYIHTRQSPYKVRVYTNYLTYGIVTLAVQDKLQQIEQHGEIKDLGSRAKNTAYQRFVADIAERCAPLISKLEEIDGIGLRTAVDLCANSTPPITSIAQLRSLPLPTYLANAIKMHGKITERIPRATITTIAKEIARLLGNAQHCVCGSYRRQKPTSGDIDLVIAKSTAFPTLSAALTALAPLLHTDLSSRSASTKYSGYIAWRGRFYHIDVRFVAPASFVPAVFYYTGSALFNVKIRSHAKKLGYKLNEYGLWRGSRRIPLSNEKDIFQELGLTYLAPAKR
jgi:DNA polymerase/3'-5' exonuclease PolX